ncbi:uncharacterized protein G2W53_033490 [Senna tora]|uniref:Uncharacterized protein n=1 Tax=Senna tora TaxID=362788 RepID=A0A834SYL1_9FABA|nr:uncharacterized protein G2W53_033490 [Senna tora]
METLHRLYKSMESVGAPTRGDVGTEEQLGLRQGPKSRNGLDPTSLSPFISIFS